MKLSTVRVSQIFTTGALHEANPEGEIERLLGEYFDELVAKYCAAGPWRYDVVNAPRDGSEVLCEFHRCEKVIITPATWQSLGRYWGTFTDATFEPKHLRAFATLNPPETPKS